MVLFKKALYNFQINEICPVCLQEEVQKQNALEIKRITKAREIWGG